MGTSKINSDRCMKRAEKTHKAGIQSFLYRSVVQPNSNLEALRTTVSDRIEALGVLFAICPGISDILGTGYARGQRQLILRALLSWDGRGRVLSGVAGSSVFVFVDHCNILPALLCRGLGAKP